MSRTLIVNARIFDGRRDAAYPGEVLIEGNRITRVAEGVAGLDRTGCAVLDAAGATLMPGLVESHAHLAFPSTTDFIETSRTLCSEERILRTAHTARALLDAGFTSAYSGGAYNARAEVVLRNAIAKGWLAGPRLKACSFERNAVGFQADPKLAYAGVAARGPDVASIVQFVDEMAEIGVDTIKLVVTGESGVVPGTSRNMQFYDEELAAASQRARERGIPLIGHCHSAESIKMGVRHGFRVIYHCTWADAEAIDMITAAKDRLFIAPSPGINWANCYEGEAYGITKEEATRQEQFETLERVSQVMPELHRRGVRVLIGGDYGFPWNPIGRNARDLELFVKLFGYTPAAALKAATTLGGELMEMQVGQVREGYLADLLLVDGNPLDDVRILQDRKRLLMIMQDGRLHKAPRSLSAAV